MSAVAVITPPTLDELAATINREHALVLDGFASAVQHAILAGEALREARNQFSYPEWDAWLTDNFPLRKSTAYSYMRMARCKDVIAGSESVNQAKRLMIGDRSGKMGADRAEYAQDVVDLHENGVPPREIAEILEISRNSVQWQLRSPEYRQRAMKRASDSAKRVRARRREEKKALERQERDAAMKKAGGDALDAYRLVRKLAPLLESLKLNSAYHKAVAIEDDLYTHVKAL